MINAVLIGAGNLASHIYRAFAKSDKLRFIQVYNRSLEHIDFVSADTAVTDDMNQLLDADIYFLCISDGAITEVSKNLPFTNRLTVHCSGASAMNILNDKNRIGVFYPLQTFLKASEADFSAIPICVEANNVKDKELLLALGNEISESVQEINSDQRAAIHIAAVFVNNFVNYLFQIGESLMEENQMDFSILHPLIEKTVMNALQDSPRNLQTGPAKRDDKGTIEKHLNQLTNQEQQNIYKTITNAILEQYGREKL